MLLSNIEENFEDVRFLLGYGFGNLVNLYFRNLSNDKDEYHWSQCLLHLLANAIRALDTPHCRFIVQCYEGLLSTELKVERVSFRSVNAHVFLLNAFGAIDIGGRDNLWREQFNASRGVFHLLASIGSPVPVVVLLRTLWDPAIAQRLRSRILDTTLLELSDPMYLKTIHDSVPIGQAVFVPKSF